MDRRRKREDKIVINGTSGTHVFLGLRFFHDLIDRIHKVVLSENSYRRSQSIHLHNLLINLQFNKSWVQSYANPIYYRRVGKQRDVLDTAGSLSDGGRYNIGGAQTSTVAVQKFGHLARKRSALYLSEDDVTARREYGDEGMLGSTAITYLVKPSNLEVLNLIEMERVFADLSSAIPMMRNLEGSPSMNGTWVDIKFPTPSQLLGHWLIENSPKGTHGIRFKSSHPKCSNNICLFFNDTRECKKILNASPHE